MKIRSLLLGSIAAAGLATTGYAADLGVVTSLDVCDELGLSGLTISSDDNCLVITGGVEYEFNWGDYNAGWGDGAAVAFFNRDSSYSRIPYVGGGANDWGSKVTAWLQFAASADSDFGVAKAVIKLKNENAGGPDIDDTGQGVNVDQAYVSIGDTTVLTAGRTDSIFADGDDAPLNFLGLYNSSDVDAGVGFRDGFDRGGHVIQVVSNLGNGFSIGGALEDLQAEGAAVGVLKYAGDNVAAHASFAAGDILDGTISSWNFHAGVTATMDNFKIVAAIAADDSDWWNALASASATFDMFTLAASVEATSESELGLGASAEFKAAEGITINAGFRWWDNDTTAAGTETWQAAAQLKAAVTETITLVGEVGYISVGPNVVPAGWVMDDASAYYGKGSLEWSPGGGFTSSVAGEINSIGGTKATFKAAKTIK